MLYPDGVNPSGKSMQRRKIMVKYQLIFPILVLALACIPIQSQMPNTSREEDFRRIEIGGQFTFLDRVDANSVTELIGRRFPASTNPDKPTVHEFGLGARFGFNFTNHIAVEAEANIFPQDKTANPVIGVPLRVAEPGGRKFQAVFGPKIGYRWKRIGIFGKLRPGFIVLDRYLAVEQVGPPDDFFIIGDIRTGVTFFNLDIGGVFEYYPSKRTIVRFDAGDTVIRYAGQQPSELNPAFTRHDLQLSVGFGFRF